jgi:hypothetical protein
MFVSSIEIQELYFYDFHAQYDIKHSTVSPRLKVGMWLSGY